MNCLTTEYLELVEEPECACRSLENGEIIKTDEDGSCACGRINIKCTIKNPYQAARTELETFTQWWVEQPIKKTIKQKAMNIYRKARMSTDEKTLYEAGYMNEDGTPTIKGQEASDFVNWKANQKELVAMAKEELEDKG